MKYELRDYQRDAAIEVLRRLRQSRRDWAEDQQGSSFALSAITGSGKTVIATAVIEALLFGSTDLESEADPRVAFLWITDDPALNRQTRGRMLDASELLHNWQLVDIDESFQDEFLAPGRVFFLNTQKWQEASRDHDRHRSPQGVAHRGRPRRRRARPRRAALSREPGHP
jgi:hypothetical protein